jgi:hypothetical protein
MQVEIDRVQGSISVPGTRVWLIVGMLFFSLRYVLESSSPSTASQTSTLCVRWLPTQLVASLPVLCSGGSADCCGDIGWRLFTKPRILLRRVGPLVAPCGKFRQRNNFDSYPRVQQTC